MTDYYNILGVSKNASQDEIKNAYKRMARINHPDKGGDKDTFQKIQEAYETLSDNNKRQQYDNPNQMNFDNMFPFGFEHPFFKHHMKQERQIIKRQDHVYTCKISLEENYFGTVKRLKVNRKQICKSCVTTCTRCNGSGTMTQHMQTGPFMQVIQKHCDTCSGSGKLNDKKCANCNYTGFIVEDKIFEIVIKRGSNSGQRFVFEQWGEQAVKDNERSGDFVVNVVVDDDKNFKRIGKDLLFNVELSFRESIVGKRIKIPHFSGEFELDTTGFGIINPNKEYIIYNRGFIDENGSSGNLRLAFIINYVDRSFDNMEIDILKTAFDKVGLE